MEGDRPEHRQQGNQNAPGIGPGGLPDDPVATAEDRVGANVDHPDVAQASETGESSDAPRDEERLTE